MGFKSHSEIQAEGRKPMAKPCTRDEWDSKLREIKISDLLGDDIEELKEWIYSHYVPTKVEYSKYWTVGIYIKNPLKTAIIIGVE